MSTMTGCLTHYGLFVETAIDGAGSVWSEVSLWDPPVKFALAWHRDGQRIRVNGTDGYVEILGAT